MKISSINVNGLYKNIEELKLLVDEEDIHILAINETKLDKETSNEIILNEMKNESLQLVIKIVNES